MAVSSSTMSLTRPNEPQKEYAAGGPWQVNLGVIIAAMGVMLLMVWFVISAIVSGWVSDQDPADIGKILAYDSWLFPVATASVGLIKVGIALVLWGIVRRLWVRVESVKESLPSLMKSSGS